MDIKEAKYVLAIANYKSINKASKALYISQPSLSKYLQNLEYKSDIKLFHHIHGEYVPTYIGERYIHYAKKLLQIEHEWNEELADIKQFKKGELSIAIPILRSSYVIPKTITRFHQQFPNVKVNIFEVASTVEKTLEDDSIDLVIYNTDQLPKQFDYQILDENEIVLVVQKNHPIVKTAIHRDGFDHPWVDVHQLKEEAFISLHQEQISSKVILDHLQELKLTLTPWMQTRSSQVALQMVQEGTGFTFVSDGYMKQLHNHEQLTVLSIGEHRLFTYMIAAYRHGQYLSEFVQQYFVIMKKFLHAKIEENKEGKS